MVRCFGRDLQLDASRSQIERAINLLRMAKREAIRSGGWAKKTWKTEPEGIDALHQSFELTYEGHKMYSHA